MTVKNLLDNLINNLPETPGVYLFIDQSDNIIYVGKAKNLKKRVASYFSKKQFENNKLRMLVRKVEYIKYIIVETETDALLLENNLIKKYQPKYNFNLKDDKTFPWICVKNERFPRIFPTRKVIDDGSKYYGPYTSVNTVRTLLSLIRKLYQLRTCKLKLTNKNIENKKFKVCLEYHIGNCKGPCENLQSEEDYNNSIANIHNILKGNIRDIITYLRNLMDEYSSMYDFENALQIKEKYDALCKFQLKSAIVRKSITNIDVLSISDDKNSAVVNFMKIIEGAVIQSHSVEIKKKLNETKEEIMEFALTDLRFRLKSNAGEVILPFNIQNLPPDVKITVPVKGDKKQLLELSQRNSKRYLLEQRQLRANITAGKSQDRILNIVMNDLIMSELPAYVECFDNSNIHGSNPVAACVVFKNGRPVKSEYRHYNIKTVKGPDDFASMKEVVLRRYSSLLKDNKPLPQLVIVDGGKGQLNAALKSFEELNLRGKIALIGIAKRLEEIYFPDDPIPLYLDKNSETLRFIRNVRNEAHRFGINFHRLKRSEYMISSEIQEIKGIGEKTISKLFRSLYSIEKIKEADINMLVNLIGKAKAKIVHDYFNENNNYDRVK